jgi:hypothetical protein
MLAMRAHEHPPLLDLQLGIAVPRSLSGGPAWFRLGFGLRLTRLDVVIGGTVAVAIVALATGKVRPRTAPDQASLTRHHATAPDRTAVDADAIPTPPQ